MRKMTRARFAKDVDGSQLSKEMNQSIFRESNFCGNFRDVDPWRMDRDCRCNFPFENDAQGYDVVELS